MKWLTVVYVLCAVIIIILVDRGLKFAFLVSIPNSDKIGHFVLIGLLAFFVNLSFSCQKKVLGSIEVLTGSLIVVIVVTLEELSQLFIISRNFDLYDLFFDYAGIICFSRLAVLVTKKFRTDAKKN